MNEELRLYTFTNFYLSSIQQGIQPAHAQNELMMAASLGETTDNEMLYDWAENHKTMICLNGGDFAGISDWCAFLHHSDNPFPFAPFFEAVGAIGPVEVMTSVAVVLPERIFDTAGLVRRLVRLPATVNYTHDHLLNEHRFVWFKDANVIRDEVFSDWEFELMQRLNKCGLAR